MAGNLSKVGVGSQAVDSNLWTDLRCAPHLAYPPGFQPPPELSQRISNDFHGGDMWAGTVFEIIDGRIPASSTDAQEALHLARESGRYSDDDIANILKGNHHKGALRKIWDANDEPTRRAKDLEAVQVREPAVERAAMDGMRSGAVTPAEAQHHICSGYRYNYLQTKRGIEWKKLDPHTPERAAYILEGKQLGLIDPKEIDETIAQRDYEVGLNFELKRFLMTEIFRPIGRGLSVTGFILFVVGAAIYFVVTWPFHRQSERKRIEESRPAKHIQ